MMGKGRGSLPSLALDRNSLRRSPRQPSIHPNRRSMRDTPNEDKPLDSKDRYLVLDVRLNRRDFLSSTMLASGALLLNANAPLLQQQQGPTGLAWEGPGGVGDYARSHGNMWATVSTAHDLRDGKIGGEAARQRAIDTGERYDLIV